MNKVTGKVNGEQTQIYEERYVATYLMEVLASIRKAY